MNLRLFFLGILASIVFLNSCNDDLKNVGITTRPDGDGNSTQADTFYIELSTEKFENGVYARSLSTSLGQMYDPLYGNVKADYLCQFYCEDNFTFQYPPINNQIDSVKLILVYKSWDGDSIAPMTAQVYPVSKSTPLDRDFYSDFDPTNYYNPADLWASKTYTPRDYSISDSLWNVITNNLYVSQNSKSYSVEIDLPIKIGQDIYDATKNEPENFINQDAFNKYFPGVYVTTSENSTGNILEVLNTGLLIYHQAKLTTTSKVTGEDSTYIGTVNEVFTPSQEVIQKNRFKHTQIDDLVGTHEYAYVKSMGGLYTKVVIPSATDKLMDKIDGRTINNLYFQIKVTPPEEDEFALQPPAHVLLLPVDSIKPHFEKSRLANSSTLSYLGTYAAASRSYNFSSDNNIANVIQRQMDNNLQDEDIELAIVPVQVTEDSNYKTVIDIQPLLTPAGMQIRTDGDLLKFYITSSKFNELD